MWRHYYFVGVEWIALRDRHSSGRIDLSFLLGDHLGSTTLTTNSAGVKTGEELYKAWGELRHSSVSIQTTFRYMGQLQAEVGLYYYVARWYDSETAHFVQADTIVPSASNSKSFDRYAYALYNPVAYNDPSGHDAGFAAAGSTREAYMYFSGYSSYYPSQIYISPKPTVTPTVTYTSTPVIQPTVMLNVPLVQQTTGATCGEAAFTMAWNYRRPSPTSEGSQAGEQDSSISYNAVLIRHITRVRMKNNGHGHLPPTCRTLGITGPITTLKKA